MVYKGKHGQSTEEYQDGRSDAGKRISGDSKSGPAAYTSRNYRKDMPVLPGQPTSPPPLSKSDVLYANTRHNDTKQENGNIKSHLRFGGPKGLPGSEPG